MNVCMHICRSWLLCEAAELGVLVDWEQKLLLSLSFLAIQIWQSLSDRSHLNSLALVVLHLVHIQAGLCSLACKRCNLIVLCRALCSRDSPRERRFPWPRCRRLVAALWRCWTSLAVWGNTRAVWSLLPRSKCDLSMSTVVSWILRCIMAPLNPPPENKNHLRFWNIQLQVVVFAPSWHFLHLLQMSTQCLWRSYYHCLSHKLHNDGGWVVWQLQVLRK